jgi:putative membrane protein (TIGR04086 family)
MKLKQVLRNIIGVIVGNLISISTDFLLSFLGPISWFFFYPKFVGVFVGSLVAGLIVRERGWLIGIIISLIHSAYVALILSFPSKYLAEKTTKIDWISLLPTAILIIAVGLIGGHLGTKLSKTKKQKGRGKVNPEW